jgi:hypothetical protein
MGIVAAAVRSGGLRQVASERSHLQTAVDITRIPHEGPWPDYIELYFVDVSSGNCFSLVAETFHGAGGRWDRAELPTA